MQTKMKTSFDQSTKFWTFFYQQFFIEDTADANLAWCHHENNAAAVPLNLKFVQNLLMTL